MLCGWSETNAKILCTWMLLTSFHLSVLFMWRTRHTDGKVEHAKERREWKVNLIDIERDDRKRENQNVDEKTERRRRRRRKKNIKPEIETVSFATLNYNNTWRLINLLRSNDLTAVHLCRIPFIGVTIFSVQLYFHFVRKLCDVIYYMVSLSNFRGDVLTHLLRIEWHNRCATIVSPINVDQWMSELMGEK